ncbi:MAG: tetratricopeptide repeat protein [Actinomycetota bacterium]|nr:tetratricopeptide repeat protein [Actinomycetota bacterium]
MAELPTGTLTLLFSDIEGSTVLLHRLGAHWGEALSVQREILRAAFAGHGGTEMGTEGDSFFVVFRSAHDALGAALEGQRGLQAQSWPRNAQLRVRMGLHTGEPQRYEDGYIGEDVHRAARIGSTANGGQIVISGATRRLVSDLAEVKIRDLGHHRLKDLAGEEPLYDVVAPGLIAEFPPLRSLGKTAALPTSRTPLIGRSKELRTVYALFVEQDARLVTLTGPGGSGKTRLATGVAANLQPHYPDGVYFVALHTIDRGEHIWASIAEVLDAGTAADGPPSGRVASHLAARHVLLVLDNLEQIKDADEVVSAVLAAGPGVRVLAASRRPLLLVGEHEFPVLPLALPDAANLDAARASAAVEMFVGHAQMIRPTFALTEENQADVAALCRRLDGLPLALELAAAHSRLLSPKALLSRIDNRLGAGVTAADRPERQRTLGATIAWSYDLLDDTERAVFRRLGVFRGSCDLDAIAAVAGDDGVETLDVASRLVGTSLVRVEDGADGEPRIALLETIRAFALERLAEAGESDPVRMRHLRWCTTVTERMSALLRGPLHLAGLDGIAAVLNDTRAALEWSLRPAADDGRERVEAGITLLNVVASYWYRFGDVAGGEARMWQERGVAVAEDVDSEPYMALLHGLGIAVLHEPDVDGAIRLFERGLAGARRLARPDLQARAHNDMAITLRDGGRFAEAMELLQESVDLAREAGHPAHEAAALSNMVICFIDLGQYTEAVRAAQDAIAADTRIGDAWGVAVDRLNYIGAILEAEGPQAAHARYVEWATDIFSFRDKDMTVELMELGANIVAGLGELSLAVRLAAGADTQRAALEIPRAMSEQRKMDAWMDVAQRALSGSHWAQAHAAGKDLAPEQGIDLVRVIGVPSRQ